MAKWRYFAERELPRVIRELGLPAALTPSDRTLAICPLHRGRLGTTSRICESCYRTAWDEIDRRYREQGRSTNTNQLEPKEETVMSLLEDEPLEGELVTTNPGTELVPHTGTLFGTADPRVALERMADVASVLVGVIKDRKLFARIGAGEHIFVEGWTTLGAMLGIVPVVVWTKPNETGDGYLARVEARTLDGRVVGAAESECSRVERTWKTRDPYALRSMAQTRATVRALRAPLGQIVVLAGYEAVAVEEIPVDDAKPGQPPPPDPIPDAVKPTKEQFARLGELLVELTDADPATDWRQRCRDLIGIPSDLMTRGIAAGLIRQLEEIAGTLEIAASEEANP